MFKRFSLHIALILLFAITQIGAMTHEISHVKDLVNHSQQDPTKQDQNTHSEQCEQCISFAKIAGGLAAQSFEFSIAQARFIGSAHYQTQALSQLLCAYAARAPPLTALI